MSYLVRRGDVLLSQKGRQISNSKRWIEQETFEKKTSAACLHGHDCPQPILVHGEVHHHLTISIIIIYLKISDPDLAAHLGVELGEEVCTLLVGDVATLLVGDHLNKVVTI